MTNYQHVFKIFGYVTPHVLLGKGCTQDSKPLSNSLQPSVWELHRHQSEGEAVAVAVCTLIVGSISILYKDLGPWSMVLIKILYLFIS